MFFKFLVPFLVVCAACAHPTVYKLNENRKLEPDLVPISSTVIPLPIYKVGYGINIAPGKTDKTHRPEGPITLITAHTKKKPIPVDKIKRDGVSDVKEVTNKEFE